jgi:hypothetical protein
MTSDRRFERDLPDLLAQLAPRQVPDYRDDVVRQTARLRQRPAWTFPERWLPMDIALAPARGRPRSFATLAVIALVGLLIAALLVTFVGSRPAPIPAPFGPAANGALFYDADGAIMAMDTVTSMPRPIITGTDAYTYPLVSRDGRLIEFDHTTATGLSQLYVANADGSNQHPLAGTYRDWTWTEWSVDSKTVGIVSTVDGARAITMLPADGSAATTLSIDQQILTFWFLADGRIAFTGSDGPGALCRPDEDANVCGLFVANGDGTGIRRIVPASEFSGLSTHPSPDGRSILYVKWTTGEEGGLHIVDIDTGVDRRVAGDTIPSSTMAVNRAWFSPDGTHVLFDWYGVSDDHWGVVPVTGGSAVQIGQAWPVRPNGAAPEAAYSPDGTSIFAWYPRTDGAAELWLLDPSGAGNDQQLTTPTTYLPVWQRTAP